MQRIFLIIVLLAVNLFAGAAPPTVADIAALKALAPGAYPTVYVLRYYSADSGNYAGGGIVNWVAGSNRAAAACSVYVPNSNPAVGRWQRVASSIRSAEQCGIHSYDDTISGVTTYPNLAGSGTRMVVVGATGTTSTQTIPAGGSLANPTGVIGLTAVNGVATSAPRSDGAPALSQAIKPVWDSLHTFSRAPIGAGFRSSVAKALYRTVSNDSLKVCGGSTGDSGMCLTLTGENTGSNNSFHLKGYGGADTVMFYTPNDGLHIEAATFFTNNVTMVPNGTLEVPYYLNVSGEGLIAHGKVSATPFAVTEVSGTIAIDANKSAFFTVTLANSATLGTPSNSYVGEHFTIRIKQDGSGGNTLDYSSAYRFPGGNVPSIDTSANSTNYESFFYDEASGKWDFVGNAFNLLPAGS